MNVSAFIESVVAAAQSPNHHWHDDQWYFNFNESVRTVPVIQRELEVVAAAAAAWPAQ
jgi:hypothetical protein